MTEEETQAISQLDALDGGDPEAAHGDADDVLLRLVHPEVLAAYVRVIGRCNWWACA